MHSDRTAVETPSSPSTTRRRRLRWVLVALPVAILAYTVILSLPGIRESTSALARISPGIVAIALALEVAAAGTLAQVYRASLRAVGGDLPYRAGLNVSMSAFTVSLVVPGGGVVGGVVAARRMMRFGVPAAVATTAVVLTGTVAMVTLAGLVGLGALSSVFSVNLSPAYVVFTALLGGILVAAVSVVLLVLHSARARGVVLGAVEKLLRPFPVDVSGWKAALEDIAGDPPRGGALAAIVGWSAVNWLCDVAVVWLAFRDFGADLDPGVLLLGYGMANLAAMIPITPGGLGLVEAGMAGTYVAFGVAASTAVVAVLAYRVVSYWLPVLAGVPMYLRPPDVGPSSP